MNGKLKYFLSTRGSSLFAVLAWIAFIVGGTALALFTLALAVTFELFAQVKKGVVKGITALIF